MRQLARPLTGGPEASETSKFVLLFDKFFDILNVTNFKNWAHKKNLFNDLLRINMMID